LLVGDGLFYFVCSMWRVVRLSMKTGQADYRCLCAAGMCAIAFHPLCARDAKFYMEVCSMEDSEDVSWPDHIRSAAGFLLCYYD
jgi:hypothetical protein